MNEELKIIISAEIDKLKQELQEAQKQTKSFSEKSKSSLQAFGKAAGAAGKAVAAGLKVAGAAIIAGGAALVGLAESTREYRTEQAKLTTAFEAAGGSAEQAKETYNDLYRVLGDSGQAVEAANHLAQLTTNQEDLAEWTTACQGIYATFGDSLPIESLTEAANETAKTGEITGALADALNWAGVSEDEFAEQLFWANSEAEREKLIRTTLTDLYGDAAATYETTAASILTANEAQAMLTDTLAQAGAAVEPVVAMFKAGLASSLQEIVPHLGTVSEGLQEMITGVDGGAEKFQSGVTALITSVLDMITNLIPTLIPVGVNIILALIQGIVSALPTLTTTLVSMIPVLLDGITQAIVAIAAALPDIMQLIVDVLPVLLSSLIDSLITAVPALITGIVQAIVILCNNFSTIIQPLIDKLPDLIIAIIDALLSNLPALIGGLITLILAVVKAIPQIIEGLIDALPTIISMIIVALLSALPQIITGLIQVVFEVVKSLPRIFASLIQGVVNVLKGIWDGLAQVFGKVGTWFKDKFKGAADGIKSAFSSIGNFFSNIWNKIKQIFSNVGATIGNAITNTVKKAINGVLSVAVKIINGFIKAINIAISVINAIPGVSISKLSELSVPKLERGGVLKKGQIGLLEGNGAEAVVPLEKNTEWLDRIAERLIAGLGGGNERPIILQVDGKTFAKTSVAAINNLTRQQGKLSLNLV